MLLVLVSVHCMRSGNVFHETNLEYFEPRYRWMCGSSTHPGGGIMGAPGRIAALEVLRDKQRGLTQGRHALSHLSRLSRMRRSS